MPVRKNTKLASRLSGIAETIEYAGNARTLQLASKRCRITPPWWGYTQLSDNFEQSLLRQAIMSNLRWFPSRLCWLQSGSELASCRCCIESPKRVDHLASVEPQGTRQK